MIGPMRERVEFENQPSEENKAQTSAGLIKSQ